MKETGGPVFPIANAEASMYASCLEDLASPNLDTAEQAHLSAKATALCGMTLRDYFAAEAMSEMTWKDKLGSALECYEIADAMLKAREQ